MSAHPRIRRARRIRERYWDQISFLDDAGAAEVGNAPDEIEGALGLADHAADPVAGHEALDRLYMHLAQRAMRLGRKPVPKRSNPQEAH